MDTADAEAPSLQVLHQVVEGVLELGEKQQALIGPVKEPLLLHDGAEMSEFGLATRVFNALGLLSELEQLADLLAGLFGVAGQCDGL